MSPPSWSASDAWLIAGWTMLHYVWVGSLLGILALTCKWLLRAAGANMRYVVALCRLAALALAPLGIAAWLDVPQNAPVSPEETHERLVRATISPSHRPPSIPTPDRLPVRSSLSETPRKAHSFVAEPAVSDTLALSDETSPTANSRAWSHVVVAFLPWIWIVGTPLVFVWSITGLAGAERLRRLSVPVRDPRVEELCRRLAISLKASRRVAVLVCRRVASPILVGVVRPAILLPPALLSELSPQQLEMVLLHELGHVRRWDNLVNFLQRIIESLLFSIRPSGSSHIGCARNESTAAMIS